MTMLASSTEGGTSAEHRLSLGREANAACAAPAGPHRVATIDIGALRDCVDDQDDCDCTEAHSSRSCYQPPAHKARVNAHRGNDIMLA